jgi:DNA-damage-inducible protein D
VVRRSGTGRSPFDVIRHGDPDGFEWWSAREMRPYMGHSRWESFTVAIRKAEAALVNSGGLKPSDYRYTWESSRTRPFQDVRLSREARSLFAMNGDPDKPEVAEAQRYFRVMTRAAEEAASADPTRATGTATPGVEAMTDHQGVETRRDRRASGRAEGHGDPAA